MSVLSLISLFPNVLSGVLKFCISLSCRKHDSSTSVNKKIKNFSAILGQFKTLKVTLYVIRYMKTNFPTLVPKDIFTVDEAIPQSFRSWVLCLLGVLGTLFVICLATPIFAAIIIPLGVVYYFVQVSWTKQQEDKEGGVRVRKRGLFIETRIRKGGTKTSPACKINPYFTSDFHWFLFSPLSLRTALLRSHFKAAASAGLSVSLADILSLWRDSGRSVSDKSLRPSGEVS